MVSTTKESSFDFVNYFAKILEYVWHIILSVFIGSKRKVLPPVVNEILLESATSLAEKIRTKQLKSEDVVRSYIRRIKQVNPLINAVVEERFMEAMDDARAVDIFISHTDKTAQVLKQEQPFLGVPFTTKNSVGIKGMIQDAGLYRLKGRRAEKDSEVVRLMKVAGAIPLVVSNVPEICMWIDSSNKVYGKTNNPYDLTKIPGGSTGGDAALIASAASIFGIGTDIGGSIRIPSYCCGIFGHKTSKEIVSNEGHFPSSYQTDLDNYKVVGPMCRYAEDLAPMLTVLAGENTKILNLDKKVDLRKIQVHYLEEYTNDNMISTISNEMKTSVKQVVNHLREKRLCEVKGFKFNVPQDKHGSIFITKLTEGTKTDVFKVVTGKEQSIFYLVLELFKCIFGLSHHTFYVLIYLVARALGNRTKADVFKRYNQFVEDLHDHFRKTLGNDGVLIMPTQPQPHYYHQETIFKAKSFCYTSIFNILGYPCTQCPTGLNTNGLPTGVQVIALPNNDHLTIAVAKELQKAFGGWHSP